MLRGLGRCGTSILGKYGATKDHVILRQPAATAVDNTGVLIR